LHIMAFITEDYRRMTRDRFMGYGKPVLTLKDDRLHVDNVPAPRHRVGEDLLSQWAGRYGDLRLMNLAMETIAARRAVRAERWQALRQATALRLFEELHQMHAASGRTGVLVHLPVKDDYFKGDSDGWRAWLRAEADRRGWIFIDLVAEYRRLPAERIDELFIANDDGRYRGARGHYTEQGNRMVAHALAHHLTIHPLLAGRLQPCCAPVRHGARHDS
ncbi:MAG: hypothetical protein LC725_12970, partial [Lentisphaerae bacterium]|nr:hypothetical protein [Lentisphaerota bacterium]